MIHLLYAGASSACFELENREPYYAPAPVKIFLDGEERLTSETNVFSLFGLKPKTGYTLTAVCGEERESVFFETASETCVLSVRDFGAVGDGAADDTVAVQTAIHFLPKGGRLYFPEGRYLVAPLALKSHITLEFSDGATLLGSPDKSRYPVLPGAVTPMDGGEEVYFGTFEGDARPMYQALISAHYAEDITLIGPGLVDGNAQNSTFWTDYATDPIARPRLFFFNRCRGITVHGLSAANSPSWQFHPYYSEELRFLDVSISAPKHSPNTDALDPESCDKVEIIGCRFSVGDDCIAIKSSKIELGRKLKKPASRHTVRNCLMAHGHGAVTLGSESAGGVRDLDVSQCYFKETDRGLRIKSRRGRGKDSVITGIVFDNIRMEDVLTPIVINLWYNCCDEDRFTEYVWSREKLPVDDRTPHMGSFHFHNMVCTGAEIAACYVDGLPEMPLDEVELKNVSISFKENAAPGIPAMQNFAEERCRLGLYFDNVRRIVLDNVTVTGAVGEELIARHYEEIIRKEK